MKGDSATGTAAWERFYCEHRRALLAYAGAWTGNADRALDLIQEVLLEVIQSGIQPAKPRAFVLRCMRNLAIDWARKSARSPMSAAEFPELLARPFMTGMESDEVSQRLHRAMAGLPALQREAIVLRAVAGLTIDEAAEVLGRPSGTIASAYARGIASLRDQLDSENGDDGKGNRTPARNLAGT